MTGVLIGRRDTRDAQAQRKRLCENSKEARKRDLIRNQTLQHIDLEL